MPVPLGALQPGPDLLDDNAFRRRDAVCNGVRLHFIHENPGGFPLLLVHGLPETKRIWYRNIKPLAAAGFEVIAPDLRGLGDSDIPESGYHGVTHMRDLIDLVERVLGHARIVTCGGDLGGRVIQEMAVFRPDLVVRQFLFNTALPSNPALYEGLDTNLRWEASDYSRRHATDIDGLLAERHTPELRIRYIEEFYSHRFWAAPGTMNALTARFHAEPFADARRLRANAMNYAAMRIFGGHPPAGEPETYLIDAVDTDTIVLWGPEDHVVRPAYPQMARRAYPNLLGPYTVEGAGHFLQWEQAGILNATLYANCRDLLG
jgi:pimeloyl-ACP methyl ester carboxylesterase